jgi:hypothetical protein
MPPAPAAAHQHHAQRPHHAAPHNPYAAAAAAAPPAPYDYAAAYAPPPAPLPLAPSPAPLLVPPAVAAKMAQSGLCAEHLALLQRVASETGYRIVLVAGPPLGGKAKASLPAPPAALPRVPSPSTNALLPSLSPPTTGSEHATTAGLSAGLSAGQSSGLGVDPVLDEAWVNTIDGGQHNLDDSKDVFEVFSASSESPAGNRTGKPASVATTSALVPRTHAAPGSTLSAPGRFAERPAGAALLPPADAVLTPPVPTIKDSIVASLAQRDGNALLYWLMRMCPDVVDHLRVAVFAASTPHGVPQLFASWADKKIPLPEQAFGEYYLYAKTVLRKELCMKLNGRGRTGTGYSQCLYGGRCKFQHECVCCGERDHGWYNAAACQKKQRIQGALRVLGWAAEPMDAVVIRLDPTAARDVVTLVAPFLTGSS